MMSNHSAKAMRLLADSVYTERNYKIPAYCDKARILLMQDIEREASEGRHKLVIIGKAISRYCADIPYDFMYTVFEMTLNSLKDMGYTIKNDSTYTVIYWDDAE